MQKLLLVLLILTCLSSAAPRTMQSKTRKRSVISLPRVHKNQKTLRPDTSKSFDCQEEMCNGTFRYPVRFLRQMLSSNNLGVLNFAGSAVKPYEPPSIEDRWFGESVSEETHFNMCATKEYHMLPKVARNVDYEWKFVVQFGNITQSVQYDKCRENGSCFAREYIPNSYATYCKQHKVVIKLLAVHSNRTISLDEFPIPGGCACAYSVVKYS